jgi:hypothetical protein
MPALASIDKSRVRYHLKYCAPNSIPAGDAGRLEEQMNSLADDYTVQRIKEHLDRCDEAFDTSRTGSGTFSQKQLVAGDINRTTVTSTNKDFITTWRNYLAETDHLAYTLNVPNYADPAQGYGRFVRYGDVSVLASSIGVPDTCVGDRIQLSGNYI